MQWRTVLAAAGIDDTTACRVIALIHRTTHCSMCDDLVQDVCLAACSYQRSSTLSSSTAYLIALGVVRDHMRRRRVREVLTLCDDLSHVVHRPTDDELHVAMRCDLSLEDRQLLEARASGMSSQALAALHGVHRSTIDRRCQAALERII